jgi:hypothetical protein
VLLLPLEVELVILSLRKKRQWLKSSAYVATANLLRGSFPKLPENQRRKIKLEVVVAIAKETQLLKQTCRIWVIGPRSCQWEGKVWESGKMGKGKIRYGVKVG